MKQHSPKKSSSPLKIKSPRSPNLNNINYINEDIAPPNPLTTLNVGSRPGTVGAEKTDIQPNAASLRSSLHTADKGVKRNSYKRNAPQTIDVEQNFPQKL